MFKVVKSFYDVGCIKAGNLCNLRIKTEERHLGYGNKLVILCSGVLKLQKWAVETCQKYIL